MRNERWISIGVVALLAIWAAFGVGNAETTNRHLSGLLQFQQLSGMNIAGGGCCCTNLASTANVCCGKACACGICCTRMHRHCVSAGSGQTNVSECNAQGCCVCQLPNNNCKVGVSERLFCICCTQNTKLD